MDRKGFTLMEVLIYTALIGIAGVFLNSTLISVLKLQGQQDAATEVNQQINFVLQNIQKSVRESSLIDMEGNIASSTLTLRMTDTALDPTLIYLSGTTVYIKKGSATPLALTTADVNADQLDFTKVSSYPGHDSVSVDISFSYNTDNPQRAFTKTINSAISRVSGATFDSDILPGADATYSVGSNANRWQNLNMSGDLTVAGNSSFTGTGSFTGNVGIGVAAGSRNLEVRGSNIGITNASADQNANLFFGKSDGTDGWAIGQGITANDGDFKIYDNQLGAVVATFKQGGNVGIGTTSLTPLGGAAGKLFVAGTGDTSILVQGGTGGAIETGLRSILTQGQVGTYTNHPFNLVQNGNPILSVISSGYVGIGTTSPAQTLSVTGTIYSSVGYRFPDGTTQTTAGGGSTVHAPTQQIFTSGSGTYTTPAGVGLIKIRMVGGGGGGGAGSTNDGAAGSDTSFNSVVAKGGSGGGGGENSFTNAGAGGTGGAGTASVRVPGGSGGGITYGNTYAAISGGIGGNSAFGGGAAAASESAAGVAAAANSGAGGSGAVYSSYSGGGGGGAGEYVELNITNPTTSYSYTVGAGGAGGTAGNYAGGAGGSGVIIVEEYYTTALSVDVTSGGNNTFTGTNTFNNGITGMWSTVSSQNVTNATTITFSGLTTGTIYRLSAVLTPTSGSTSATWWLRVNNVSTASYVYGENYSVSAAAAGAQGSTAAVGCPFQDSTGTVNAGSDVVNLMTEPFRSSPGDSTKQLITYSAGNTYTAGGSIFNEHVTCYSKVGTMTSLTIVPPIGVTGWALLEKMN